MSEFGKQTMRPSFTVWNYVACGAILLLSAALCFSLLNYWRLAADTRAVMVKALEVNKAAIETRQWANAFGSIYTLGVLAELNPDDADLIAKTRLAIEATLQAVKEANDADTPVTTRNAE